MFVAAVIGALVVGVAWLGQLVFTGDSDSGRSDEAVQQSGAIEPLADREAPVDGVRTRLERCQEVFAAQEEPLRAAAASMEQWEVHIGAMNKLVVGAISLKQAYQFWNQTRVGASQRLAAVAAANRDFGKRSARCPPPTGSPGATPMLSGCYRAVAARNGTLSRAGVALRTWQIHVHHMNMLRSGEMTPDEATALWLQSWKQGDREVRAYREAARAAEGLTC
jgi:hypothetical protein